MKRKWLVLLLVILLLPLPAVFAEDGETAAKDLSAYLRIEHGGGHPNAKGLIDTKIDETFPYAQYETVRLSWAKAPEQPATLCIQWGAFPQHVRLQQTDKHGEVLTDTEAEPLYNAIVPLRADAAGVRIIADAEGMDIARIALYSEGDLPSPFFPWKETPRGMDFMLIATHPDDDVLFMGGIIPTYGSEQGYIGTVAYVTNPSCKRVNEALLGMWEMGAAYHPVFLGFQDIRESIKDQFANRFQEETVTLALVRMLREYRPLVVFSHDVNGEYGHWQHKIVAAAVTKAVRLCADPTFDPLSVEQLGTWEVRKCYLHLYRKDTLVMDIRTPLASRGGRTALQVAQDAFTMHSSQQNGRHTVQGERDQHPMNRFGMVYGTVEAGKDVFDNIDPTLLSKYTASEEPPTPEPTEEPTPEPTEEPTLQATEAPTEAPQTPEPTEEPTPEPVATPAATPAIEPQPERKAANWLIPAVCALLGAAVAAGCFLLIGRRKRR